MGSKNSLISKLARNLDATGDITADAIASTVSLGAKIYASRANLPSSGNTAGDQAYVTDNNRLYIWNGSGWYNIALLNLAPSISSVLDSDGGTTPFILATDGTPTTITITAADSDGDPITYEYSADSDFAGLATLSQADNVFTITPLSQDSATTTSGTITFTATDGINTASSGVQTFTLTFLSPLWDETVLSIGTSSTNSLANSTFIDRSTNASTVTTSGSPVQTAFHPYLDNWSVEFDGTDDYLTFADTTDWDFVNSGDFTVDFWMNSRITSNICPFGQSGGGGSRSDKWGLYINDTTVGLTAGTIGWHLGSNGNIQGPSITINANQWYHIQVSRASDTWYFFQDGTLLGTVSSTTRPSVATTPLYIGADGESYRDFNGYLSNVRIVKGTNLNTSSFTSPTENLTAITNTVLLTCQDNRFEDNSSNAYTATVVGTPKISAFNPFGQGSEYAVGENKGSTYFDGSSNIIVDDESASGSIYPANSDWTISCWFYGTGAGTGAGALFTWGASGIYSPFNIYADQTSLVLRAPLSTTGSSWDLASDTNITGSNWNLNSWNHVEFCRSGTDFDFFLNGSLIRTVTSSSALMTPTEDITIGKRPTDAPYTGYIADMQYILGTALHTSDFTPPTSPVTHANSVMYLPMDNAGIYDKTGNSTLTPVGNASTSTTQTKFADTAMYFDGTGDAIVVNDNLKMFNLISGPFTVEAWYYQTSSSGYATIASMHDPTNDKRAWTICQIGTGDMGYYISSNGTGTSYRASGSKPLNTWTHIAFTRDDQDVVRLFINGVQGGTDLTFSTIFDTGGDVPLVIGGQWNGGVYREFPGYIENLQILPGVAKYTSNFTPPTQTQGRTYQAVS